MKPATDFNRVKNPGILKMIRAPFLSSILAPVFAGTLLAVSINGHLYILEFILVTVTGIGLHVATNVYNDIYDTLQGTDKVNVHRNESSGGSGVLLDNPGLMGQMFFLARSGLANRTGRNASSQFQIAGGTQAIPLGLIPVIGIFQQILYGSSIQAGIQGIGRNIRLAGIWSDGNINRRPGTGYRISSAGSFTYAGNRPEYVIYLTGGSDDRH
jgi:1,4-dihydroxy-2-naphthoate octaprenyltransferase